MAPTAARRREVYGRRFDAWAALVAAAAEAARARPECSGKVGLLGFSNGGFLAVATAARDPRLDVLVVFYGGLPRGLARQPIRLPPLLALHGAMSTVSSRSTRAAPWSPSQSRPAPRPSSRSIPGPVTASI